LKLQIVNGGSGDGSATVPGGHNACQLVDPFHQLTAEESAVMVNISGANQVLLLCERVADLLFLSHKISALSVFFIIIANI
jgi:hypothetical protein